LRPSMRTKPRHLTAALSAALLLSGCAGAAHRANPGGATTGQHCAVPFNAGSRLPGFLNPAYPRSGLYPASGGNPPSAVPSIVLRARSDTLVVTYGQPLEGPATISNGRMVSGVAQGAWQTIPLAAGFTFEMFGPPVPLFGVVPGPVVTGRRAGGMRDVWLVTQWSAAQTLTILRGTNALAEAAAGWRQIPPGVSPANLQRAAATVRTAEAAGWTKVGEYPAEPACGAAPDHLGPFGARAALRLPLNVPLELISPQYGGMVLRVGPG